MIEIRRDAPLKQDAEGAIDEIVGRGSFHLERMSDAEFALILESEDGDRLCVMIIPKVWPKHGRPKHIAARIFWHDEPKAPPAPED